MKTLIAFYSRTGTTRKVAEEIAGQLKCKSEEIIDTKNRSSVLGYIKAGKDATLKRLTLIQKTKNQPENYELIIIGTPVWAHNMAPAVRAYIMQNKDKFRKTAFFCTMGGTGADSTFREMEKISAKPAATLVLTAKEVVAGKFADKVKVFVNKLK